MAARNSVHRSSSGRLPPTSSRYVRGRAGNVPQSECRGKDSLFANTDRALSFYNGSLSFLFYLIRRPDKGNEENARVKMRKKEKKKEGRKEERETEEKKEETFDL